MEIVPTPEALIFVEFTNPAVVTPIFEYVEFKEFVVIIPELTCVNCDEKEFVLKTFNVVTIPVLVTLRFDVVVNPDEKISLAVRIPTVTIPDTEN